MNFDFKTFVVGGGKKRPQTCNTNTSYTISDFRPPQKILKNQFNLKLECRCIGTITSIYFDAFL